MVRLSSITTKTGDAGTTGLVDGSRVSKNHSRIHALGAVDEANAALGLLRASLSQGSEDDALACGVSLIETVQHIQNDLFDLGADLATPLNDSAISQKALRITEKQVARIENQQETLGAALPPLESFILPGNTSLSAQFYMARALIRRAERQMWALNEEEAVNPHALTYVNRLSDLLFTLIRQQEDVFARVHEGSEGSRMPGAGGSWEPGATDPRTIEERNAVGVDGRE